MFRKAFTLVLFGVLVMGAVTVAYGTFFDKGFVASAAGVLGADEGDDDEHAGRDLQDRQHDHDKDDDHD